MPFLTIPIGKPPSSPAGRASRREYSSSRTPACLHSFAVLGAAFPARIEVPSEIEFRSAILAGIGRIMGLALASADALFALPHRVFAVIQKVLSRSIHAHQSEAWSQACGTPISSARNPTR